MNPASTDAGPSTVVIGAAAPPLRRALTSAAGAALECLVARSHGAGAERVAELSVRGLAAELGVSKNTALRALATLTDAGVVEAEQRRRADGTFLPARYHLHLPADVLDVTPAPKTRRATKPSPPAHATPSVEPAQLSLLDTA